MCQYCMVLHSEQGHPGDISEAALHSYNKFVTQHRNSYSDRGVSPYVKLLDSISAHKLYVLNDYSLLEQLFPCRILF